MDYHSPYFFGYVIGFIHLLGIVAAIHALLTVRTAQGSITLGNAAGIYSLLHPDSLHGVWP